MSVIVDALALFTATLTEGRLLSLARAASVFEGLAELVDYCDQLEEVSGRLGVEAGRVVRLRRLADAARNLQLEAQDYARGEPPGWRGLLRSIESGP